MNKRDLDGYKYCLDKAKSNKHKNFYNYLSISKKKLSNLVYFPLNLNFPYLYL